MNTHSTHRIMSRGLCWPVIASLLLGAGCTGELNNNASESPIESPSSRLDMTVTGEGTQDQHTMSEDMSPPEDMGQGAYMIMSQKKGYEKSTRDF